MSEDQPTINVQIGEDAQIAGSVIVNTGTMTTIVQTAQAVTSLHQLRAPLSDFVGRVAERAALHAALAPDGENARVAAICGMGGLGKTELALRVANDLRDEYPDAQLSIAMRDSAAGPPRGIAETLRDAIRAFDPQGALPDDETALAAMYCGLLGGKRALILLDDAPDDASVRVFLPPAGCALIITSRTRLTLGGQGIIVDLSLLSRDEARQLLVDDAPRIKNDSALEAILERCGDLPLAVRVAGATLANNEALSPQRYLARLSNQKKRVNALHYDDTDVYAVLGIAHDELAQVEPELARRWCMVCVCPAPFDAAAASSIWDEHDEDVLDDTLGLLTRRSLARYDVKTRQYRIHDLLRDIAAQHRSTEDDQAARLRHAAHFITLGREADRLYARGGDDMLKGLALFNASWIHIRIAATWIIANPSPQTDPLCQWAPDSTTALAVRLTPRERQGWCTAAAAAAVRLGDKRGEARALLGLGDVHRYLREYERAHELYERSLGLAREVHDRQCESWAFAGLSLFVASRGDLPHSIGYCEAWLQIAREIDDRRGEGQAIAQLASTYFLQGQIDKSIEYAEQSLNVLRDVGDKHTESIVLNNLADALISQERYQQAIDCLTQALALIRSLGDRRVESDISWTLGEALMRIGDNASALPYLQRTVAYEREVGDPRAEEDAQTVATVQAKVAEQTT